jgi:molybdopterin/thiamine biosynthesis adenylyltransferase/rhodanese-related sulfurtransferase
MPGFRELLAKAKENIREIDPAEAESRLDEATFLDVRELDEYEQGMIPGALFVPRGHLESQIENRIPDHDSPVVVYCAGGTRSAFAAETLQQLGYTDVTSMSGGFGRWKNEDRPWVTPAVLSPEQRNRYGRHLLLPEVGEVGQQKLLDSRILLLGAGGLGSPAALYLAAAGVGTLGIVDMDVVDSSNLQRQILHNVDRIGERKVDSAKKTLTQLNPDVDVVTYDVRFGADNVLDILDGYDVVVDGTDNFPTRYLLNDASLVKRIPVVHGSIFRFEGQVTVFKPYEGPCYRCLLPEPPPPELAPSCAEAGVLGVLPGIIGTIQATETIKLLLGIGEPLVGRFIVYDALRMRFRELKLSRDPHCAVCGENPSILELRAYEGYCVPDTGRSGSDITVRELKDRMDRGDAPLVIDVREPHEHAICRIPSAVLIPAAELSSRLSEFDPNREIAVHCRSGGRSSRAVALMREKGFKNARNLTGGVLAWVSEIDPTQPKY